MSEKTNHLSNTLITLSDNKIGVEDPNVTPDNLADFYEARVLSATDYYAFGMAMKERTWQSETYRYGFNGKEKDKDFGEETTDFGARLMNSKIGRWFATDPQESEFPEYSPYCYSFNSPLAFVDPDGESPVSIFIKAIMKNGIKKATRNYIESRIQSRIRAYMGRNLMSKKVAKQFADDVDEISTMLDSEWWEYLIEAIPYVGDVYSVVDLSIKGKKLWDKVHRLEKWANLYFEAADKAFKRLGKLSGSKGKGEDFVNKIIDDANEAGKNLNADHLQAALGDMKGTPLLKESGKAWDHLNDVSERLAQLNTAITSLSNKIKHSDLIRAKKKNKKATQKELDTILSGDVLTEAKKLRDNLIKQRKTIQKVLDKGRLEAQSQ